MYLISFSLRLLFTAGHKYVDSVAEITESVQLGFYLHYLKTPEMYQSSVAEGTQSMVSQHIIHLMPKRSYSVRNTLAPLRFAVFFFLLPLSKATALA